MLRPDALVQRATTSSGFVRAELVSKLLRAELTHPAAALTKATYTYSCRPRLDIAAVEQVLDFVRAELKRTTTALTKSIAHTHTHTHARGRARAHTHTHRLCLDVGAAAEFMESEEMALADKQALVCSLFCFVLLAA